MQLNFMPLKLRNSYRKNIPEIRAYFYRLYPDFVLNHKITDLYNEVPVFTFHSINTDDFEECLKYLCENNYCTLNVSNFFEIITNKRNVPQRSVLLTFDDGWGSLWTYAYPLLKKYNMHAVCFLIPGVINSDHQKYYNLEDVWAGRIGYEDLISRESSAEPYCTWEEIFEMYQAGVIDFQSHTLYHSQVFTSTKIIDFIHPNFDCANGNHNIPIIMRNGENAWDRNLDLGTPIYHYEPRMSGKKRYLDDENLRLHCTQFVAKQGGSDFFRDKNWRSTLFSLIKKYNTDHQNQGYYESQDDLEQGILEDLRLSKKIIEEKLPGNTVTHLCYPYYVGSQLAVDLSIQAGYKCSYWGFMDGKSTNRAGDDPHKIVRLSDEFIFLLPGNGRKRFTDVLLKKLKLGKNILTKITKHH